MLGGRADAIRLTSIVPGLSGARALRQKLNELAIWLAARAAPEYTKSPTWTRGKHSRVSLGSAGGRLFGPTRASG